MRNDRSRASGLILGVGGLVAGGVHNRRRPTPTSAVCDAWFNVNLNHEFGKYVLGMHEG
jgi:hypothetical protein